MESSNLWNTYSSRRNDRCQIARRRPSRLGVGVHGMQRNARVGGAACLGTERHGTTRHGASASASGHLAGRAGRWLAPLASELAASRIPGAGPTGSGGDMPTARRGARTSPHDARGLLL